MILLSGIADPVITQEGVDMERQELIDLGQRWAMAEITQDTDTLATIVHADFRLVGPGTAK